MSKNSVGRLLLARPGEDHRPGPRFALPMALTLGGCLISALPLTATAQEAPVVETHEPAASTELAAPESMESAESSEAAALLPTIPLERAEPDPVQDEAPQAPQIEEVVVTATKRSENVREIPASITALSGEDLEQRGAQDTADIVKLIPGVNLTSTGDTPARVTIRGISSDIGTGSTTGILFGNVTFSETYVPVVSLDPNPFDMASVEVLKGPQGTLFGRNATGGAFNISSRTPSLTTPELQVSTGYAKFDQLTTRLYVNVPLTETLAANVSATYNHGDNYYDGTRAGEPLPVEVERGARARVLWQPADWMDLTVTGIKHHKDGLASTALPNIQPSAATSALYLFATGQEYQVPDEYKVFIDVPSFFKLDNEVTYAQLGLHPSWFDIKILGSYQKVSTDNNYDFDGTEAPFITFDARGQFAEVNTAELQFISNKESGPDWLEWVAGIYYLKQEVGFPRNRLSGGGLDLSDDALFAAQLPPEVQDSFNGLSDALSGALGVPLPDGGSVALISLQEAEATAYFGQATINFTEQLYLTLGGRFQEETRKVIDSAVGTANTDGSITGPLVSLGKPEKDDTNFSPKVVAGYKPMDDALIYGSWSKGFKSGTFNTVNIYDAPEYVLPEEVTSYELGSKVTFAGGQMQLNAAAFRNEIENQQVQFVSLLAGGAVRLENAAEVEINGGELELTYKPDWNTGLFMGGSLTYLDATYGSYPNASAFDEPFGLYNGGTGDFSGNRTVRTPEWAGNAFVNQLIALSHGDLEFGVSGFYSSDLYFQPSNTEISRQKSYMTFDGQVSYLHNASQVRITLLGRNLSDERYQLTQFHTDAGVAHFLNPPRAFGVRLDWTFN